MLKRILLIVGVALFSVGRARSEDWQASVEIPRLSVSEYHRPYVAMWIQDEKRKCVANLAVWYQQTRSGEGEGTKWLPDLRQWWRRSGRSLQMPVDGISGATRPAGKHELTFDDQDNRFSGLSAGKYSVVVEASREVGGRELIELPFTWPSDKPQKLSASGKEELGEITFVIPATESLSQN
ncbi:DUF2271 domain-containing protein [Rhodopirellula halodulae]|uniref:DUF2271 domain-containing protein n=1 Tax=Rhodopirellula halodulae TaxID=2894198 RepID=UPI001E54673A|nr:DUF2271 domain-containing protein [Rhodopirellula sp. JC737]MCC9656187.1 DUF2271 domain-containing protein [Rhodopirellula sp. JC737]